MLVAAWHRQVQYMNDSKRSNLFPLTVDNTTYPTLIYLKKALQQGHTHYTADTPVHVLFLLILQRYSKLFSQDCTADIGHRSKLVFHYCLLLSSSYHIPYNCLGVSLTQFIRHHFITTANSVPRVLLLQSSIIQQCPLLS